MNNLFISSADFALFFVLYKLVLSRTSFHQLNRIYLIFGLIISGIIPFIPAPAIVISALPMTEIVLSEFLVGSTTEFSSQSSGFTRVEIIYGIGATIFLTSFIMKLLKTLRLTFNSQSYLIQQEHVAFSFFKKLVISAGFKGEQRAMIEEHENVHVTQFHSADILLFELFKVVFWFNPFMHLAAKEIKLTHEFIADELSRKRFGTDYQYTVLNQAMNTNVFPLTNSFFNKSFIKQRIMKMNQTRSDKKAMISYLLIIPVIGISLAMNACNDQAGLPEELAKEASLQELIESPTKEAVYEKSENLDSHPEFVGGQEAMYGYLVKAIKYPEELKEEKVEGIVYMSYVINANGEVRNVEIIKSHDDRFNASSIEAIQNMPIHKPGMKDGKPVAVKLQMPIRYTLK